MEAIAGLDHVIILARDLADAEARMHRLGFRPTPRALHSPAMGTANLTVPFRDQTYFELLSVVEETPLAAAFAARLKEREGPCSIAMKTLDAGQAAAEFGRAGCAEGGATAFSRPVDLPDGPREAAFTIARLAPATTPGCWMFVCQHHTPEVVWRPDYLEQPNGVVGLQEVIGITVDMSAVEAAYQRLFGAGRVVRTRDGISIAAGDAWISYLEPLAFAARFGRMPRCSGPHLAALTFRTASLEQLRGVLGEHGIPHATSFAESVLVPPEGALGTLLEFVPASRPA